MNKKESTKAMMFISKFNRLIRSKTLWLFFTVIIVLSFVFWGASTSGVKENDGEKAGVLNGKNISRKEFSEAFLHVHFSVMMQFGDHIQINDQVRAMLENMAWKRIASLDTAKKMKISATHDEFVATIKNYPLFSENGQFMQQRYQSFLRMVLPQMGLTSAFFEEHMNQEIILNKLKFIFSQATWVSPWDAQNSFSQLHDIFQFSYVKITADNLEQIPEATEDEAIELLNTNPEKYMFPEMATVKYVCFSAADYIDLEKVADTDIAVFYDEHIHDFSTTDTNGVVTTKPIETVTDDIKEFLAEQHALNHAWDLAAELELTLTPERGTEAPSFDDAVANMDKTVLVTEPFSLTQSIKGLDVGTEFNRAAFDLINQPHEYFSRPIMGKNNVYVLAWNTREEPRIPAFEEIEEQLMQEATKTALHKALQDKAHESIAAIELAMAEGKTFSESAKELELEIITTEPFKIISDLDDVSDDFNVLLEKVINANPGETTEAIVYSDSALFAHLDSRTPADQDLYNVMSQQITSYIKARRDSVLISDWQESLIANDKLKEPVKQTNENEEDPEY